MKIIDLTPKNEKLYFVCLEDWSDEMKEAGNHKAQWYKKMKPKGLRVKLAQDESGAICGMIQYLPIEHSFVSGKGLCFVLCIWVHGHQQGIGNYQNQGYGKALLAAAEADARAFDYKGLVVWGLAVPVFMQAAWFKKQGYTKINQKGVTVLLWKTFSGDAEPPHFVSPKKKVEKTKGKVTIHAFRFGWCPSADITYERIKRAASHFGDAILLKEYDTTKEEIWDEWGIRDALYIDTKLINTGPPPSYDHIYKLLRKKAKRVNP